MARVLTRIETYYDAVPRSSARAEDFGPLTFFVREGADGWPFYARPTLGHPGGVSPADVEKVRARQRELGLPEAFEWVAETAPALRAAVEASGLVVHEHPLMVLDGAPLPVPEPAGAAVRTLAADDPDLPAAVAAPYAAFGATPGPADAARVASRIASGLTVLAAAFDTTTGEALAGGQVQPVGDVAEVVGVGTRPEARRRGLGLAVTAELVARARAAGTEVVFLTASDATVERLYARLGFRTIATALIAEV
ncbi:GNAT family N-acetyltransferase [Streptomyces sp. R302]|uniref:GNAT family N-acetyltransferase n=1 Tax=unclassified Streptomyces TaxID=2593676 RepID=UPI00145E16B4|nr:MULTISPECIES: GNAT family N-acetyltransferase [unclassified Streptomyces]NML54860.1 GNAT family N-acetyltransferase [Streptomyces sp. R301]NML83547.1 GNAT family N-acetyltransferase [Streptomyces sp. R302]